MAVSRHKLTYDDYMNFPDDGIRRELIDGEVYEMPSPNARHQRLAFRVARMIADFVDGQSLGEVFIPPFDVVLGLHDVVQPDVVFVSNADMKVLTEANIRGAPTLAVEVLSDPARDRRTKRALYEARGVPEYWIVDPDADRVEVFRRGERGYGKPDILEPGDTLTTQLIPGLQIDVAQLLRR